MHCTPKKYFQELVDPLCLTKCQWVISCGELQFAQNDGFFGWYKQKVPAKMFWRWMSNLGGKQKHTDIRCGRSHTGK
jgi:hypothetical protein